MSNEQEKELKWHTWFVCVGGIATIVLKLPITVKDTTKLFPTFWMIKRFNNQMGYNFKLRMRI